MTREVQGLRFVKLLSERPSCIPHGRPRGAKAHGVKYEEALAKLPQFALASHGVWLEFDDARGHGFAQADFVFSREGAFVIAEAKLTWTPAAYVQLRKLYFPLFSKFTAWPVGGIVVCQNLTRETPKADVCGTLPEALAMVEFDPRRIPVLHLPILPKEPSHAPRTKSGLPSWWRKGQTASRVGHSGG